MRKHKTFRIGALFEILTPKKRFNANTLSSFNGKYRYVVRSDNNNGIRGYISEDEQYLNPANTISFGQDTATMFFQNAPYFTGDKIKVFSLRGRELNREIAVYLIASMKKSFIHFGWGKTSFSVGALEQVEISLPVNDSGEVDFDFMSTRIRELELARIRELVAYLKVTGLMDYQLTADEERFLADYRALGGGGNL
jgi:ribosomal protein S15P/S13E